MISGVSTTAMQKLNVQMYQVITTVHVSMVTLVMDSNVLITMNVVILRSQIQPMELSMNFGVSTIVMSMLSVQTCPVTTTALALTDTLAMVLNVLTTTNAVLMQLPILQAV